jgi:hypothetical protein
MENKEKIRLEILSCQIHPSEFEITQEEMDFANQVQDDLFDKLNNLGIIFIQSSSDTIIRDLIIGRRVDPNFGINQFIGLYSEIHKYLQGPK